LCIDGRVATDERDRKQRGWLDMDVKVNER
jgi:hypothetical protein